MVTDFPPPSKEFIEALAKRMYMRVAEASERKPDWDNPQSRSINREYWRAAAVAAIADYDCALLDVGYVGTNRLARDASNPGADEKNSEHKPAE